MVFYFLFIFFNFIGVWLLYIVLVSAVQQSRKLCIYKTIRYILYIMKL